MNRETCGHFTPKDMHCDKCASAASMSADTPRTGDWWCPSCKVGLDGSRVTYDERCDTCGTPVSVAGEGDIVRLERENARLREEVELIRAALTGDDYASLPSDLPTVRMAHTIRADHDKFRNQVRDTCHRAEQAEKELAEAKRDYTEKDRQYHMDAINRLASFLAMSGTSFEVVQAAIDNMTRLVAQKNLAIQSAKEWREQKQRADSYALDIEELQEQLRQLNAAYHTETQAKILSDACYENQYHRAEQAEARALAAENKVAWQEVEIADLRHDVTRLHKTVSECEERALAAEKDAGRYRFLCEGEYQDDGEMWNAISNTSIKDEWDAEIDAAIAGAKHD